MTTKPPAPRITNGQYRRAALAKAVAQPSAIKIQPHGDLHRTFEGAYVSVVVWVTHEEARAQS